MTKVIFEVDKLQETDLIGRLVTSNAGRDTGKSCIISKDKNINLKIKRFLKLSSTNKEV